jgi:hypothetical protein
MAVVAGTSAVALVPEPVAGTSAVALVEEPVAGTSAVALVEEAERRTLAPAVADGAAAAGGAVLARPLARVLRLVRARPRVRV